MNTNEKTSTSKEPIKIKDTLIPFRYKNLWGYCDHQKKVVVPPKYSSVDRFSDGLALVWGDEGYGFVNLAGKEQIPLQYHVCDYYNEFYSFSQGRAQVCRNGRYGFIDTNNQLIVPCVHHVVYPYSEGFADVDSGERSYFIDREGNEAAQFSGYIPYGSFENGLARVRKKGQGMGFIDTGGVEQIPCIYDEIERADNDLFHAKLGNKIGWLNQKGEWVADTSHLKKVHRFVEGRAMIEIGKECGVINLEGQLITEQKYDMVEKFSEGLAFVYRSGYIGYIDGEGKENYPIDYNEGASSFYEGLAAVFHGGKAGFIDRNFNLVFDFEYDSVLGQTVMRSVGFLDGLALVQKDNMQGYIDQQNNQYWKD